MRSAKLKILIPFLFLLIFSVSGFAAEESPVQDKIAQELENIQSRLETIEKQQQDILAKEDKILEELNRVRIWVHRK